MPQQVFVTSSLGGYFALPWLTNKLRTVAAPMYKFRQFCNVREAFGQRRGATAMWDKVSAISTRGGTLSETSTIPRRNFTITQGSVVITEYGNAIDYTLKLEKLAEYEVPEIVRSRLRDDTAYTLDVAAGTKFVGAKFVAVATTTASTVFVTTGANSLATSSNQAGWYGPSDINWRDCIDYMKKKNIPKYAGDDYAAIGSVNFFRGLYDYLEAAFAYTTREHMLNGEIGKYYGCRGVEENNYLSNAKGSNASGGEGVFIGDDAVWEAVAIPEEIRVNVPSDFGRDQGIAWYYLGGFEKVWEYSTDSEEHLLYYTSG